MYRLSSLDKVATNESKMERTNNNNELEHVSRSQVTKEYPAEDKQNETGRSATEPKKSKKKNNSATMSKNITTGQTIEDKKNKLGWGVTLDSATEGTAIKLVVVGDVAVGKTCFLMRYTSREFPQDYIPTFFDNYHTQITHNNTLVVLALWDISGVDHDPIRPLSYVSTDIFLMMFSLVSQSSLDKISTIWNPELTHHAPGAIRLLIGNKADLRDDPNTIAKLAERKMQPITDEQADLLCKRIDARCYIPCSSLTGYNVDEVVDRALSLALDQIFCRNEADKDKRRCVIM